MSSTRSWLLWAICSLAQLAPSVRSDELILCGWDEVFALAQGPSAIGTNKIWSWKAKTSPGLPPHLWDSFRSTDECKPVNGGRNILITSSGGGVALVERATGKSLFYASVGNAHSAELLPGNRVVVAGSRHDQGNCLALFDLDKPERRIYSEPLDSGHGVAWDEQRQILWALGYQELKALRLQNWNDSAPGFETISVHRLPDKSGHDLVPVPHSADLLLTTDSHVFLFDRDRKTFRPHPELGDKPGVKGAAIHPRSGHLVYIQAEGTNWWAGSLRMLQPSGELRLPGERLYKARWAIRD